MIQAGSEPEQKQGHKSLAQNRRTKKAAPLFECSFEFGVSEFALLNQRNDEQ